MELEIIDYVEKALTQDEINEFKEFDIYLQDIETETVPF